METWEFHIGNTFEKTIIVSVYNDDIDEMYFTVKKSNSDENYVLQKTLENGITIVEDKIEEGIRYRTYNLMIDADDTEGMKTNFEYPFDIKIVTKKTETDIKGTILEGVIILDDATTRKWNEVVS